MRVYDLESRTLPVEQSRNLVLFLRDTTPIAYAASPIYRGRQSNKEKTKLLYAEPAKEPRRSANTSNYYTVLIDSILPSWKNFPNRSKSFICSTRFNTAHQYGDVYRMYPVGDPIIALCPSEDIWDSFNYCENLDEFNNGFEYIQDLLGCIASDSENDILETIDKLDKLWKYGKSAKNYKNDEIDESFKQLYKKLTNINNDITFSDKRFNNATTFISFIINTLMPSCNIEISIRSHDTFYKWLDWVMNPEFNGFELIHLSEFTDVYSNKSREIWFSEKTYLVLTDADTVNKR